MRIMCMGYDHSSTGTESLGHSKSTVGIRVRKDDNAVGLTSILDREQFSLFISLAINSILEFATDQLCRPSNAVGLSVRVFGQ